MLYSFDKAAVTKYQKLGDLNNSNLLSHSSGRKKSSVTVLGESVSSEGTEVGPSYLLGVWASLGFL